MKIARASIVSCFNAEAVVGTKVVDQEAFDALLEATVAPVDFTAQRTRCIPLPSEAIDMVSGGVGLRTEDPEDFVIRNHRGQLHLYLKREKASKADSVAAIVYTRDAYTADPEVDEAEAARVAESTHVLVAVLASVGPRPPRCPGRFTAALAGENHDYDFLTAPGGGVGGGTVRAKVDVNWIARVACVRDDAKEVIEYHRKWCVVAD